MDWSRLAQAIVARRVEMGFKTRPAFSRHSGMSLRVIADLETAGRDNFDPVTLARLERALEWPPGRVRQILRGSAEMSVNPTSGQLLHPSGWEIPSEIDELLELLRPDHPQVDAAARKAILRLLGAAAVAAQEIVRRTPPGDVAPVSGAGAFFADIDLPNPLRADG